MKIISIVLAALIPVMGQAQQVEAPQNPNTFGHWEFESESGMHGQVVLNFNFCHYTIISSFSSMQARCQAIWYEGSDKLILIPFTDAQGRPAGTFTVPDYQPAQGQGPAFNYSVGNPTFSFEMTTFGTDWMAGHLLGPSDHDTVKFTRH